MIVHLTPTRPIFTVGHSNHAMEEFIGLLRRHQIDTVFDVRSQPYSRFNPQFNRECLEQALGVRGTRYVFLGQELGARRIDLRGSDDGKVDYGLVVKAESFQAGLARIRQESFKHRIAIMCAEKDPITCHRMVLVCRQLRDDNLDIRHIHPDGSVETMSDAEDRLLASLGLEAQDLFRQREEMLQEAYERQGKRIAYEDPAPQKA